MTLRDTQELFWRAIVWPTGVDDFLAHADPQTRRRFEQTFVSTPGFDRVERMRVYAEAYFWRLHDVLAHQFPALAFELGAIDFHNLVTDYVLARPPVDAQLRRLGDGLPDQLGRHRLAQGRPWLVELAALEHARWRLLDVVDEVTTTRAQMAAIGLERWPSLRFRVPACVALLRSEWDVHALWLSAHEAAPGSGGRPGPARGEHWQLVWRNGFSVRHRAPSRAEGRALATLVGGGSFADVAAHAERGAGGQRDPGQVVAWLSGWLDDGLIAELVVAAGEQ